MSVTRKLARRREPSARVRQLEEQRDVAITLLAQLRIRLGQSESETTNAIQEVIAVLNGKAPWRGPKP